MDLIGASLVMKAVHSKIVDQDLGALIDYYDEHIATDADRDQLLEEELIDRVSSRVAKYKSLKFSVAQEIGPFNEVRRT